MIRSYTISVEADSKEDAIKKLGWAAQGLASGQIPFDGYVMVSTRFAAPTSFNDTMKRLDEIASEGSL